MTELMKVYPVFLIWLIAAIVGWLFIWGMMLPPCGVTFKQLKGRDKRIRNAIKGGMDSPWFWVGFWGSLVCVVVNSFAPVGLFGSIPAWSVLGILALNIASNLWITIPLRGWLWRIHTEKSKDSQLAKGYK